MHAPRLRIWPVDLDYILLSLYLFGNAENAENVLHHIGRTEYRWLNSYQHATVS